MSIIKNSEIYCHFINKKVRVGQSHILNSGRVFSIKYCYVSEDENNKEIIHECKYRDSGSCILV